MSGNPLVVTEAVEAGVVLVTLNRPEKRNALSIELLEQLCATVEQAEATKANRVLVLRGAGPVFCAGLDLAQAADESNASKCAHLVARMLQTVVESRLISIAAVHGAAVAGGAGLMTACDLVVIEENAKISYPEVHRGLVAALVSNLLASQVPDRAARELLLLGETIDADRALSIGLVNRVVGCDKAYDTALSMAWQVQKGGPQAIERTKKLLNQAAAFYLAGDRASALDEHLAARNSRESVEGLAAFNEKRAPRWRE